MRQTARFYTSRIKDDDQEVKRIVKTLAQQKKGGEDYMFPFHDLLTYVNATYVNSGVCTNILGEPVEENLTQALHGMQIDGVIFNNPPDFNVADVNWCRVNGFMKHKTVFAGTFTIVVLHFDSESG